MFMSTACCGASNTHRSAKQQHTGLCFTRKVAAHALQLTAVLFVPLCSSAPTPDSRPDTSVVSAKEDSLLSASGPNGQAGAYQSGNYRWAWRVHATFWRQGALCTLSV